MTLDDLKTGDIVEFRHGGLAVVIPAPDNEDSCGYEFCPTGGGFTPYNIDMKCDNCPDCDIMKVFKSSEPFTTGARLIVDVIKHQRIKFTKEFLEDSWSWERDKEDALIKAKKEAYEVSDVVLSKITKVNSQLSSKQAKARLEFIKNLIDEIDWNAWELGFEESEV